MQPQKPIVAGERVMIVDSKERRYLVRMTEGAQFHTHAGIVNHDDVIGGDEGIYVEAVNGRKFLNS